MIVIRNHALAWKYMEERVYKLQMIPSDMWQDMTKSEWINVMERLRECDPMREWMNVKETVKEFDPMCEWINVMEKLLECGPMKNT